MEANVVKSAAEAAKSGDPPNLLVKAVELKATGIIPTTIAMTSASFVRFR